ncbi:hypothetical protein GNI_141140 [Gregarina niphandrodes]|uniref:Uncharacterized protein n=1 Tax=Gregarina niphandrodes TaxID=110365 RepID=A0A023B116_GRENI|nr:hypothetical protein GNI_141140 [Gregarina niphandrodes]EZG45079.1 hypothetical protein GNI_141140 [Gregarina niphandrodes]|eukprot:XP_011132583.1 hypothetical protein GNI_141140 [Gregarina niphandrodes]
MIGAAIDYEWPIHVSIIHGSHRAWPPRELLVNRHPIYVKFADYVIIPRRGLDTADSMANAIRRRMLRLMLDVPGHDPVIERPLLKTSDLKKIMELAQSRSEIRESFLN